MIISLLALSLALAQDASQVVVTAPATALPPADAPAPAAVEAPAVTLASTLAHDLTTDQQIARWIEDRRADGPVPFEDARPAADRRLHGEVIAGIGTHGYRDGGVRLSVPIGDGGRLDLSYRRTENGLWSYGPDDWRYGRSAAARDWPWALDAAEAWDISRPR